MAARAEEISSVIPWWAFDCIDDLETEIFWITGGLGSGKSYGAAIWFLERCLRNYRSRLSWAVAPTHSKVRDILLPTFQEVLFSHFGLREGIHYEVLISKPPILRFLETGHEVHFHSGNRPDLMVGTNISHYMVTEVGLQKREVFERCQTRARCGKAEVNQGLLEGTPEGANWYAEIANFEDYDPENRARRFQLFTEDNPHIRPGYVEKLKRTYGYDPARLESYLYGRFVPFTKGTAYWEFAHSQNVVLDVAASPALPILFNWDFGTAPLPWVAMQRQPFDRRGGRYLRFVALAEGSGKARGIMDACAEFIAAFDPVKYANTPIEIWGGHDGYFGSHLSEACAYDQILTILRKYYRNVSVRASRSAPTIEARLNQVNALLAHQLFVVAAWCKNLIASLTNSCLKDGQWQLEKKRGDDPTHFADSVGDALFTLTKGEDFDNPTTPRARGLNMI